MSGKNLADASGPVVVLSNLLLHNLPAIVTVIGGLLSILWYGVRLYDRFILKQPSSDEE